MIVCGKIHDTSQFMELYKMAKPLLQRDIVYAQSQTRSHAEAARYLNVSFTTYKRYARAYNLYENEHKNKAGKGISKLKSKGLFGLQEILDGKHPNYDRHKLKERLVKAGYLPNECGVCGHASHRPDGRGPYLLTYKDNNRHNLSLENLQLICYNCQFLTTGRITIDAIVPDSHMANVMPTIQDYDSVFTPEELEALRNALQEHDANEAEAWTTNQNDT